MVRDKLKGLSRDALIYGVGDALGRMIGLIMLPILSRIFGPADYGAIDLLAISYQFLLTTLNLGVPSGVQRFYFRGDTSERNTMLTSCLALLVVLATVGGIVVALFAPHLSAMIIGDPQSLRIPILLLALQLPIEQVWVYQILLLRMQRRAVAFAMASIAMVIITPTLTFLFVVTLRLGLTGVFSAGIIAFSVVTVGLILLNRNQFSNRISYGSMREVVRFTLPGHPGQLVRQSMTILPRYLLAHFAPLTAVGLFGIASRVSSVVRIYVEAFNRSWNPFAYANEGSVDEKRIYEVVFKMMFMSLVVITTGISFLAPEVLALLTPVGYEGAAYLVPGVVVYLGVDGLILILSTVLYTRDRVQWTSYLGLLKLGVLLVVGLALVPRYHATGLVIALVAAALAHLISYVRVVQSVFRLDIPSRRMISLTIVASMMVQAMNQLELAPARLVAFKFATLLALATTTFLVMLSRNDLRKVRSFVSARN